MEEKRSAGSVRSELELQADYRSRLYGSYVKTHFGHIRDLSPAALERHRRTFRQYFARLLPQDRSSRILEVGCGYGAFLYFLKAEGYRNAEGIDVSQEQIEMGRRLGVSNISCMDVIAFLSGRSEAYDCIVAIDFLDHFPKDQVLGVLDSLYNAIRTGGTLILQVVNGDGPFAARLRYSDFTHAFALTAVSPKQILGVVGFRDIRVLSTDPFIHGLASMIRVLVWRVMRAMLWIYLVAETGVTTGHILTQNLIVVACKLSPGRERSCIR